jgi:hypothetical protein
MSTPDPNWNRWILQSIIDHYKTNVVDPNTITFLVDGIDLRDNTFMTAPERVELRINGPDTKELSKSCWRLWVNINIFFTVSMGQEATNRYSLETLVGLFLEFTDTNIPIFRFGTGPGDDSSLVGCLEPRREISNSVRSVYFGQISAEETLKQAQIDGRYEMIVQF